MNTEKTYRTAVILSGGCLCAAMILFRGFHPLTLSLLPLAAAAGFSAGTVLFPVTAVSMLACAAAPAALPWICLAAGLAASAAGKCMAVRMAGFVTAASVLWSIPAAGAVILLISAALCVFISRTARLHPVILAAGFLVSAFIAEFPDNEIMEPETARSFIEGEEIRYEVPSLRGDCREVLLHAPCDGEWLMWITLSTGGVRDTLPMVALLHREELTVLPPGEETVCFSMTPGETLTVRLLRDHIPFNHPVVHISAGGERL